MHRLRLGLLGLLILVIGALPASATTEYFVNNALSTLAAPIGSTDVTLVMGSTTNFPTSPPFRLTIQDTQTSTPEIVYVTAVSGNTYTITRGYEGSTASAHVAGAQVGQFVTAGVIQSIWNNNTGGLLAANNLSDLANAATSRTNLGVAIGSAVEAWSSALDTLAGKTLQGTGTKIQLSTGTTTTNDCVKFDSTGNVVDAGATCGSGGGSGTIPVTTVGTSGSSQSIAFPASGSAAYDVTLTANCTFTLTGGTASQYQTVTLILRQNVTAGWTPTLPSGVKWPGGIAPTPNTAAGKIDVFTLSTSDGGTTVFGTY